MFFCSTSVVFPAGCGEMRVYMSSVLCFDWLCSWVPVILLKGNVRHKSYDSSPSLAIREVVRRLQSQRQPCTLLPNTQGPSLRLHAQTHSYTLDRGQHQCQGTAINTITAFQSRAGARLCLCAWYGNACERRCVLKGRRGRTPFTSRNDFLYGARTATRGH